MVRIVYYDACLVQQHFFEIDKSFDKTDIVSKLKNILYFLDRYELNFACGCSLLPSDSADPNIEVFSLTYDTMDQDLINDISFVLDLALKYSA